MAVGALLDGRRKPSAKDIADVLGRAASLYDDLMKFMDFEYSLIGALEYGGQKYGWAMEFRKGGKPLATLFPADKKFVAQIVLGRDASAEAAKLNLGNHVREVFDHARQLFDGRWLFIPVTSKRDLEDVKRLIRLKAGTKKK